jgi:phosphoribosylamine--glycine ligase
LRDFSLRMHDRAAVAVVMAAKGYPDSPEKGSVILGLEAASAVADVSVFHAGTAAGADGGVVASGGRVLTVCGVGADVAAARERAYAGVKAVDWPQGFCRRDIAGRVS